MKKGISITGLLFCQCMFSQIQFSSLDDMLKYAGEHSVTVKTSVLQNEIQKTQEKQSKAYLLPAISGNVGMTDNLTIQPTLVPTQLFDPTAPEGSFKEMKFGRQYMYSVGIQANWDVLNFQKIFASQTAKLETEAGKINIEKTKFNLYNQLSSTYYSILLAEESLKIYNENQRVSAQLFEIAQNQFSKGIISEIEFNRAKIQNLENQKSIDFANNNLKQLFQQLQSQLNTEESVLIKDDVQNLSSLDLNFSNKHPEVQFQEAETKIYEANLKQTKALRLPNISLQYQYNYNWASDDFLGFSGANEIPQQFVGLKMNIPIFNGFQTKNKIVESEQQLQLQQLQLENTRLAKAKEDQILVLQYQQVTEQLEKAKEILELQQKNDQHAENKYTSGIIGLDERLDKYQDLLSVQNDYLQSLADYALVQYKIYIRELQF